MGRREDRDGDMRQIVANMRDWAGEMEVSDTALAAVVGTNFCPLIWASLTWPQKEAIVKFAVLTADTALDMGE